MGRVVNISTMNGTKPTPTENEPHPRRTRRTYDAVFKQSAIAHCQRHGGDLARTAQELGLNHWTLRDWVQEDRRHKQPPAPALTRADVQAENLRLRADLARVTEQRDILKKFLEPV